MRGHLYNENYLAMLCALVVPLAIVQMVLPSQSRWSRVLAGVLVLAFLSLIVLSECRTAVVAVGIAIPCLLISLFQGSRPIRGLRRLAALRPVALGAGLLAIGAAALLFLYQLKPASASGRIFLWRISVSIFGDHPVWGVGFGKLPHYMGLYHGKYFEGGAATPAETFIPSILESAFNQYLEVAVEFGLVGLLIWTPFWCLILRHTWTGLSRAPLAPGQSPDPSEQRRKIRSFQPAGYAGSVLVYLLMSTFYDPNRALVMALIFTFCLAAMVSENHQQGVEDSG